MLGNQPSLSKIMLCYNFQRPEDTSTLQPVPQGHRLTISSVPTRHNRRRPQADVPSTPIRYTMQDPLGNIPRTTTCHNNQRPQRIIPITLTCHKDPHLLPNSNNLHRILRINCQLETGSLTCPAHNTPLTCPSN